MSIIKPSLPEDTRDNERSAHLELSRDYVCPVTLIERTLVEIWSHVLNLSSVGIYHNFFDLGGDALQMMQVRYLAQEKGLNFSLQQLIHNPTINALALLLQEEVAR